VYLFFEKGGEFIFVTFFILNICPNFLAQRNVPALITALSAFMKLMFRRFLAFFMALVVLTASTGFGVVEHHCILRGKSLHLVALSKQKCGSCATTKESTTPDGQTIIKKRTCCEDQQRYENVEVASSVTQWVAKLLKATTDWVVETFVAVFKVVLEFFLPTSAGSSSVYSFTSLFHGRSMLSFVQSFLI